SLLIDVGDQSDRNTERVDQKFQINRMLAPRWDLAIYQRGVLALSPDEVNAIFDVAYVGRFDSLMKVRIDRMTAPFFGKRDSTTKKAPQPGTNILPGFDDD